MSKYSEYLKSRKESDMNFFFGENNYKKTSNKYFEFKRVLDDDNIIIVTANITIVKGSFVLVVDNNKAVYLKPWQIKEVSSWYDGIDAFAIKLNRNFFKTYTFSSDFKNFSFDKEETFDDLMEVAKEQEKENMRFKLGAISKC